MIKIQTIIFNMALVGLINCLEQQSRKPIGIGKQNQLCTVCNCLTTLEADSHVAECKTRSGSIKILTKLTYLEILCEDNGTLINIEHLLEIEFANKTFNSIVIQNCVLPFISLAETLHKFGSTDNMKKLKLLSNRIGTLSGNIFTNLSSLQELVIESADLKAIDDSCFTPLTALQKLTLSGNTLTILPRGMFTALPALKFLTISNNTRELRLHESVLESEHLLQQLNIINCKIRLVPIKILASCPQLKKLSLIKNDLTNLSPLGFSALFKLEYLDLSHNHIIRLNSKIFWGLINVRTILMSNNDINHIDLSAFDGLPYLEVVNLAHNHLAHPQYINTVASNLFFDAVFQLRWNDEIPNRQKLFDKILNDYYIVTPHLLDLSYNNFTDVQLIIPRFNSAPLILKLDHNQISTATWTGTDNNGDVILFLNKNPFKCDCYLHDLVRRIQTGDNFGIAIKAKDGKCASPTKFSGVLLRELPRKELTCKSSHKCPENCSCHVWPESSSLQLKCIRPPHTNVPTPSFQKLTHLDLQLLQLPVAPLILPKDIHMLILRALKLTSDDVLALLPSLPETLSILDVRDNDLDIKIAYKLGSMKKSVQYLLSGNPLHCNCQNMLDVEVLKSIRNKIIDYEDLICIAENNEKYTITAVQSKLVCAERHKTILGGALGGCGLLALFCGLAAVYYKHKHQIKVWLYARGWLAWYTNTPELVGDTSEDTEYDVFVSYCHHDENWVLRELVANLEQPPFSLRVCVHVRDWRPGEMIATQIARSVRCSRRTIVVLSQNFLDSEWGRMEFRTAHIRAMAEKRNHLLVIILESLVPSDVIDEELQAYLSTNTYVLASDPWFWDKLRYALPRSKLCSSETEPIAVNILPLPSTSS